MLRVNLDDEEDDMECMKCDDMKSDESVTANQKEASISVNNDDEEDDDDVVFRPSNKFNGFSQDNWALGMCAYIFVFGLLPWDHKPQLFMDDNTGDDTAYWDMIASLNSTQEQQMTFQLVEKFKSVPSDGVSNAGHDFIQQLLTLNPHDRMTTPGALEHPWIRSRKSPSSLQRLFSSNSSLK